MKHSRTETKIKSEMVEQSAAHLKQMNEGLNEVAQTSNVITESSVQSKQSQKQADSLLNRQLAK